VRCFWCVKVPCRSKKKFFEGIVDSIYWIYLICTIVFLFVLTLFSFVLQKVSLLRMQVWLFLIFLHAKVTTKIWNFYRIRSGTFYTTKFMLFLCFSLCKKYETLHAKGTTKAWNFYTTKKLILVSCFWGNQEGYKGKLSQSLLMFRLRVRIPRRS
jgi:hypothetical protein